MRKRGASERLAFTFCGNTAAGTCGVPAESIFGGVKTRTPRKNLRGVAHDALRLCGAANQICKERSDGIAHLAPSVLRAEFTQGASGSPREKSLIFRVGLKIASAKGENPVRATTQPPLIFVEKAA